MLLSRIVIIVDELIKQNLKPHDFNLYYVISNHQTSKLLTSELKRTRRTWVRVPRHLDATQMFLKKSTSLSKRMNI